MATLRVRCRKCSGDGKIASYTESSSGLIDCPRCAGTGYRDWGELDIAELEDKLDDILDKCNDIFKKINEKRTIHPR